MRNKDAICWANGDRCFGCAHVNGKAPHCAYRPVTILSRLGSYLKGECSFRNVFVDRAENKQGIRIETREGLDNE